jgi:trehalose 6-phosphate phosphatase
MIMRGPFIPEGNVALFLDVDGTLIEIAATPESVRVPGALRNTLQLAAQRQAGALALISGRSIAELDRLFGLCAIPAAGLHGFERRTATGQLIRPGVDAGALDAVRHALLDLERGHNGLLLEDKGFALAMHYRLAPQFEELVSDVLTRLAQPMEQQFVLKRGKCVLELCPRGYTKRTAIEAFMREPPFAARIPIFVGDDVTDEDGFDAVNALDGYSIRVGPPVQTRARFQFSSVAAVIAWLRERNLN